MQEPFYSSSNEIYYLLVGCHRHRPVHIHTDLSVTFLIRFVLEWTQQRAVPTKTCIKLPEVV